MKIKKIGECFNNTSIEYVVIGRCNEIIATFRVDTETHDIYSIIFTTTSFNEIKNIMEMLENENY